MNKKKMVHNVYQYFKHESLQADEALCNAGNNNARCQEWGGTAFNI
jgi:hypothetical protein